jgi:hypothetical protein
VEPYNGGGTPHFANGQSAVFSPFSLPFYVLPFKAALLFTAALKLLVLGGFTYLFLRELGLYRISAFLGGVAFAFGGHNVLLLGYPHPAAAAALPACLYFIELAFQHFDAHGLPAPWALAGLCLSMTMGFLAGQPEPCFFAVGFSFLYAIARAVVSWRRKGGTRAVFVAIAPRLLRVFAAAVIAVGITAFRRCRSSSTCARVACWSSARGFRRRSCRAPGPCSSFPACWGIHPPATTCIPPCRLRISRPRTWLTRVR